MPLHDISSTITYGRYLSSYGPGASSFRGPQSRPFWFWITEAELANQPGLEQWRAEALANAIGWAARATKPEILT